MSAPPQPDATDGCRHPIDCFLAAPRERAGLCTNPIAPAATLLARAAYVLTGLPATDAQRERIAAQPTAEQFATLVDELLASPHYGERQGRHWLDLARYSDSNGVDENHAYAHAYRYRDWVVRAHNDDLAFDRFTRMQIAGDLLVDEPGVGLDGYTATGFLALGPRMLAEQDKEKLQLDTVDEQLDLIGQTFLGLTLGCARCHEHKFDPVSAADYYALAGILRSTQAYQSLEKVSRWHLRALESDVDSKTRERLREKAAAAKRALQQAEQQANQAQRDALRNSTGQALLAGDALARRACYVEAEVNHATSLAADQRTWGSREVVVLHTVTPGPQFVEWLIQVPFAGRWRWHMRYAAQDARPMRASVDGFTVADAALAQTTGGWLPAHQQWHEVGEAELQAGEHRLRLQANGPHAPHLDALHLVPVDLASAVEEAALRGLLPPLVIRAAALFASRPNDPILALWRRGGSPPSDQEELAAHCQTLFAGELGEPARALLFDRGGLLDLEPATLVPYRSAEQAAHLAALAQAQQASEAALPPPVPMVMAVTEGKVVDLPVHLRGNHQTLAAQSTQRSTLSSLCPLVPAPNMPKDRSGRAEFAAWLVDPRLPLLARVQVNRIWQRAFGVGLCSTPSNFGNRGDVPLHLDLLDYLARDFIAHGWSQKYLWKQLLLSRTWQLSSRDQAAAQVIDPDNRLWWRNHRQRLDAESSRDAMLVASGELDRQVGGTLLSFADHQLVTNDQSHNLARYDSLRRSLYLPVIRNAMYEWFAAFDYVDPSVHLPSRGSNPSASQALLLLNSDFTAQRGLALAQRTADCQTAPQRLTRLWQLALHRAPKPEEVVAAQAWLQHWPQDPEPGWARLAQTLLISNEFLHVD